MTTKVFAAGEMLVTDVGEVIIDEVIPRTRALLIKPEAYVHVQFDPHEPPPPPCAGGAVNELDWELFIQPIHHDHNHRHQNKPNEELKLKIFWRVSSARTILWRIHVPY